MIIRATKETMKLWRDKQWSTVIYLHANANPWGYCEGTFEDERMVMALAFMAMLDDPQIHKKKTRDGRTVWLVVSKRLDTVAALLVGWQPKTEVNTEVKLIGFRDTFDNRGMQGLLDLGSGREKVS